jgi:hypothetical protein
MWAAVAELHAGNLMLVGGLTVLPLLVVVERRLRGEVRPRVAVARERVEGGREIDLGKMLSGLLPDEEKEEADSDLVRLLGRWKKRANHVEAAEAIVGPLRRQLWRRALLVAVGVIAVATLYMGVLAWAMIPVEVAERWVDAPIDTANVDLLGIQFAVPLGPYLLVSGLLGTLASAVLLASVAVDEGYAAHLASALLDEPAEVGVAVSAPYLAIRKRRPPKVE